MRLEDINAAIANLERIRGESAPDDPVTATAAIDSALQNLWSLQSELAQRDSEAWQEQPGNSVTPADFGINDQGAVVNRQKLQQAIQDLGERIKKAQLIHREKKAEAIGFIQQFRPKVSLKSSSAAADVLHELEKTRRILIVVKLHLGSLNQGNGPKDRYRLAIGSKTAVKDHFEQVMRDVVAEKVLVEREHPVGSASGLPTKPVYATRYFYNTVSDPRLQHSQSERIETLHRSTPHTVDYVFRNLAARTEPVLVFYPRDSKERAALRINQSVYARQLASGSGTPSESDLPRLKDKYSLVTDTFQRACQTAKINPGENASPLEYAQLFSFLDERIRCARILITELLVCWSSRRNQARFVKQVKILDRPIAVVGERITEWKGRIAILSQHRRKLLEAKDAQNDSAFKRAVLDVVREMNGARIGAALSPSFWPAMEGELGSRERRHLNELRTTLGDSFENLTALEAALSLTIRKSRHALKRRDLAWTDVLKDWASDNVRDRAIECFAKEDILFLRNLAVSCLDVEVAGLAQVVRWARGDIEQRKKFDWPAYGKKLEQQIRKLGGVVAYIDQFEGAYAPMRTFIMRALFGTDPSNSVEHDGTAWRKCLYVGSATIAIQIYCAAELTVASYFKLGARLALQIAGSISQDDDRRVRAKVAFSVVLSGEATASASAQDLIEQDVGLQLLNAKLSAAAESNLVTMSSIKSYQSPEHMAACWADTLAYLQSCLRRPFTWLADPLDPAKRYKLFDPDKADATQEACLQQLLGANPTLKADFDLLRERRVKAFSRQGPSTKVSFDLRLPALALHEETKAHEDNRTSFSAIDFPGGKRTAHLWRLRASGDGGGKKAEAITHRWTRSQLASWYFNVALDAAWSVPADIPSEENPLNLVPLQESAPETDNISASFQTGAGTIDFVLSHVRNHPIADNDGTYLNLRANRTWGLSAASAFSPVALTFNKTHAKVFDPKKVRRQVNRIWELGRQYYLRSPIAEPGKERPEGATVESWLKISKSNDSAPMLAILTTLSVYGRVELNYCHTGKSFELQYARLWRTYSLAASAEVEALPFLKVGAEMAGTLEYCPYETLGVNTISYILTVYNGFNRRKPGKRKYWDEYRDYHIEELHAFFNWFHPGQNWYEEIDDSKGALADSGANHTEAEEAKSKLIESADRLLQLAKITIPSHYQAAEYDAMLQVLPDASRFSVPRAVSSPTRARVVVPTGFGASFVMIHDPIAFRCSPFFTLDSYERDKRCPISRDEIPIFTLRSESPYKILWGVTAPQLFKAAKLELLDKNESVIWEQIIDQKQSEILGYAGEDLQQKPENGSRVRVHRMGRRLFIRRYGNHFPSAARPMLASNNDQEDRENFYIETIDWDGKKGGTLRKNELFGGTALEASGSPYCLRLTVMPMGVLRDWGAVKPVAWTYFAVLDNPIAKLEAWMSARGKFQPFQQSSHWVKRKIEPTSADTDLALVGENEVDAAELLVADEVGKQHPVTGVDEQGTAPQNPPEPPVVASEPQPLQEPPWDGSLGGVLVPLDIPTSVNPTPGGPAYILRSQRQEETWSCGLHALRNGLLLLQFHVDCAGQPNAVLRAQAALKLNRQLNSQQAFRAAFDRWSNAELIPSIAENNGLTAADLRQLISAAVNRSICLVDGIAKLLPRKIVAIGQFGPQGELPETDTARELVRAVRALEASSEARAFALGVGQHFITCLVHRVDVNLELLITDSLSESFETLRPPITHLLEWINDLEEHISRTFEYAFSDCTTGPNVLAQDDYLWDSAVSFLEDCRPTGMNRYESFRKNANNAMGNRTDPFAIDLRAKLDSLYRAVGSDLN